MIGIPYKDINDTLIKTVEEIDIIKEANNQQNPDGFYTMQVDTLAGQPPTNSNSIRIGWIADKEKEKEDTFGSEQRDYVFRVLCLFTRMGANSLHFVEDLNSLYSLLLKEHFRLSDNMLCNVHERDGNGKIKQHNDGNPVIIDTIDLRDYLHIGLVSAEFGSPQGSGFSMLLKFDFEEYELPENYCVSIEHRIKEVLIYGEKNCFNEDSSPFQRLREGE
jgi:hypothetical protein